MEIKRVFGDSLAKKYQDLYKNEYIKGVFSGAIDILGLYSDVYDTLKIIIGEELENLMEGISKSNYKTICIICGAGLSAYMYWDLSNTSIDSRISRLRLVPPGWRMEALSSGRHWLAKLVGEIAPVRAWMVEINSIAAALAWSTALDMESILKKPLPALPFVLHGLALDSFARGLKDSKASIPLSLSIASQNSLDGYANGFAKNASEKITLMGKGPMINPYYNSLIELARQYKISEIESINSGDFLEMIQANATILDFMAGLHRFGVNYGNLENIYSDDAIVDKYPFVILFH